MLKASRDAGVKRVVMTSSIAAIVYGRSERAEPFSEADWTDETNRNDTSAYERSKTIAERAAWAWHKAEGGAARTRHRQSGVGPGACAWIGFLRFA